MAYKKKGETYIHYFSSALIKNGNYYFQDLNPICFAAMKKAELFFFVSITIHSSAIGL